jgi:hypothetical protein
MLTRYPIAAGKRREAVNRLLRSAASWAGFTGGALVDANPFADRRLTNAQ